LVVACFALFAFLLLLYYSCWLFLCSFNCVDFGVSYPPSVCLLLST
jgi:hypothetical protein